MANPEIPCVTSNLFQSIQVSVNEIEDEFFGNFKNGKRNTTSCKD